MHKGRVKGLAHKEGHYARFWHFGQFKSLEARYGSHPVQIEAARIGNDGELLKREGQVWIGIFPD